MIKERKLIGFAGLATIAVLAACGGGGGGSLLGSGAAAPTVASASAPPAGQAAVRFSISVPGTGTALNGRSPKYIDPSTRSLTMTLLQNNGSATNGTVQGPFNLTVGSPGCTGSTPLVCTFSVDAPIGSDVFLANTFSGTNAQGPLGSGAVALSVLQNATNSANLTLTGPVTTVATVSNNGAFFDTLYDGNGPFVFAPSAALLAPGVGSKARASAMGVRRPLGAQASPAPIPSERVFIIGADAAGNVILNPTQYNQPIQVTLNLNSGTANVTLADSPPAGLTCPGSGTATSVDQGSVLVCSPSDQVTLSIIPTIASASKSFFNSFLCCGSFNFNFPFLTATLPSAPGVTLATFPFTVEVNPAPSPTPNGQLPITVQ